MLDHLRHAEEKGKILTSLQTDFGSRMTTVRTLLGGLDLLGFPMTPEGLQFALSYLEESGYVVCLRARDTPGWRGDRPMGQTPEAIVTVKLSVKGLHLIDGVIAADPLVRF